MGVLEDLRDFIYLELPQRPVLIKGATASGVPTDSTIAKVNMAPIGTFYLRDDVSPKTLQYKAGSLAIEWKEISGVTYDNTAGIIDSTASENIIIYSLPNIKTNNRYLHYLPSIPSNIIGWAGEKLSVLNKITFAGKNLAGDSTAIIMDMNDNIISSISLSATQYNNTIEPNIIILPTTQIKILIKSTVGLDYPTIKLNLT